jgi:hypothetical protein
VSTLFGRVQGAVDPQAGALTTAAYRCAQDYETPLYRVQAGQEFSTPGEGRLAGNPVPARLVRGSHICDTGPPFPVIFWPDVWEKSDPPSLVLSVIDHISGSRRGYYGPPVVDTCHAVGSESAPTRWLECVAVGAVLWPVVVLSSRIPPRGFPGAQPVR